ncbi:GEMI8-like protein [Mya arenaria]|uniref:GEMI8-like protein n=1 Tax=Mya arenaria TaxID=6604 RepID=A0ABY7DKB9_MYAAR|nr:GEMI8-like protein [Mya arenaria]
MASTNQQEAMSCSDLDIASQSGTDIGNGSNDESTTPTGETVTEDSEDGVCNISIEFTEVSDLDPTLLDTEYTGSDYDESKPEQPKIDKFQFLQDIDFSSRNWYRNDCFRAYWEHYSQSMSWCQKHFQTYNNVFKRTRSQFAQHSPFPSFVNPNQYPSFNCDFNFVRPSQYPSSNSGRSNRVPSEIGSISEASTGSKSRPRRRRGGKKKSKNKANSDINSTTPDAGTTGSEIEMEITQDMIDFFAKSDEHRRQRVKVGGERVPTVDAPKERPGARRTAEMKLLYGKGAAMIHGMETALQMAFDRNTDTKQPRVWPNMPLKIVFSSSTKSQSD